MAQLIKRPPFLWVMLTLATLGTLLLISCGSGANKTAAGATATTGNATRQAAFSMQTVRVSIVENNGRYAFSPAAITVPKGSQVVWVDSSDASHTVTSNNGGFASSGLINPKQSFSATFPNAGTFAYHCTVHPYMTGTVTVRP